MPPKRKPTKEAKAAKVAADAAAALARQRAPKRQRTQTAPKYLPEVPSESPLKDERVEKERVRKLYAGKPVLAAYWAIVMGDHAAYLAAPAAPKPN